MHWPGENALLHEQFSIEKMPRLLSCRSNAMGETKYGYDASFSIVDAWLSRQLSLLYSRHSADPSDIITSDLYYQTIVCGISRFLPLCTASY